MAPANEVDSVTHVMEAIRDYIQDVFLAWAVTIEEGREAHRREHIRPAAAV